MFLGLDTLCGVLLASTGITITIDPPVGEPAPVAPSNLAAPVAPPPPPAPSGMPVDFDQVSGAVEIDGGDSIRGAHSVGSGIGSLAATVTREGEEAEVRLLDIGPDGAFAWKLPAGRYVIWSLVVSAPGYTSVLPLRWRFEAGSAEREVRLGRIRFELGSGVGHLERHCARRG